MAQTWKMSKGPLLNDSDMFNILRLANKSPFPGS